MTILLSGGKTMGHITPLISVRTFLKEKYEFIYIGNKDSMEEEKCKEEGISFISIDTFPFYRKNVFKNIKTFKQIKKETKRLKKLLEKENIKAIITSGGFVSIPVLLAFKNNKKIKKILLESNAIMGLANKVLARYVDKICFQFDVTKHQKGLHTGSPILIKNETDFLFLKNGKKILFLGGSNGAKEIVELAYNFNQKHPEISIYVLTGERYFKIYNFNENVYEYKKINNVAGYFKYFDVVVSRAGGATISELIKTKTPNILFPSKNVANNHQYKNAIYLEKKNATINIYSSSDIENIYNLFIDQNLKQIQIINLEKLNELNPLEKINFLLENHIK